MKQYIFVFIVVFLFSCNNKKTETIDNSIISVDTLFERKIPVLTFNNNVLKNDIDSIVEKEINCYYFRKDTTCLYMLVRALKNDTLFGIFSCDYYMIDFSEIGFDEIKRIDGIYGYFKYKKFDFFCYTSCMKYTDLFYETSDSVKVKNSPLLYVYKPQIDDSRTQWCYIYKNKELIEDGKTTCKQK